MKSDNPTYAAFANPYLQCVSCGRRAVGYVAGKELVTWPCGHGEDVVSLCPTWSPVDGCSCTEPHGVPPEAMRDKGKARLK